jgi:hypothetical protein
LSLGIKKHLDASKVSVVRSHVQRRLTFLVAFIHVSRKKGAKPQVLTLGSSKMHYRVDDTTVVKKEKVNMCGKRALLRAVGSFSEIREQTRRNEQFDGNYG